MTRNSRITTPVSDFQKEAEHILESILKRQRYNSETRDTLASYLNKVVKTANKR